MKKKNEETKQTQATAEEIVKVNPAEVMAKSMESFELPHYKEIPDVGLFLEQTAKYIAGYTKELDSVSLTGSMISNYVKKKIIANPVKKQYDREQIAYLIFISITKTVLALEDVQLMFELQKQVCSCEEAYEYFRSELLEALTEIFDPERGMGSKERTGGGSLVNRENAPAMNGKAAEASALAAKGAAESEEKGAGEKILLKNTIIAVAHKAYLDKYFILLRENRDMYMN